MRKASLRGLTAGLIFAFASCSAITAFAADAPARISDGVLVSSASGMTLYTFDQDSAGKSTCNGPCAANWPPLMAAGSDQSMGDFTVVKREDGSHQWARKGKPLYFFKGDQKAGDRNGDNIKGMWHVIKE